MEFINESMLIWFFCAVALVGLLQLIAKNRPTEVQPGMATKSDQFSMSTVFLSVRSGEAPLFFCVLAITFFVFLFAIAFSKEIRGLLPI